MTLLLSCCAYYKYHSFRLAVSAPASSLCLSSCHFRLVVVNHWLRFSRGRCLRPILISHRFPPRSWQCRQCEALTPPTLPNLPLPNSTPQVTLIPHQRPDPRLYIPTDLQRHITSLCHHATRVCNTVFRLLVLQIQPSWPCHRFRCRLRLFPLRLGLCLLVREIRALQRLP